MATINFKHEENQKVWNEYFEIRVTETIEKLRVKNELEVSQGKIDKKTGNVKLIRSDELLEHDAKMSLNQYKPACLALEKITGKKFSDVIADELEAFINSDAVKNTSHVRGFYITAVTSGLVSCSKELMASLIPAEYKQIVEMLLK